MATAARLRSHGDLPILNIDGDGPEAYVAALDIATGKIRWKTPRRDPFAQAYTTPLVIRVGAGAGATLYQERLGGNYSASPVCAARLETLARAGGLPPTLRELGVAREALPLLAADAATQWTGTFNPRPFNAAAGLALYERAYGV